MEEDLLNLAEVEISKSIVKLLRSEPFYAHVVANLSRKMDSNIPTMAVTYRNEQLFLLINPSFLIHNLDEKQRIAVLKHEILHIIFKHLKRTTDKNPFVLNLAADIVVNQFVKPWPLPDGAIYTTTFPDLRLRPNKTLEYYYNKLINLKDKDAETKFPISLNKFKELESDKNQPIGSHELWNDENSQLGIDRILDKILKAAKDKTDSNAWGKLPGVLKDSIDFLLKKPELNWKHLIRIFSSSCGKTVLRTTHRKESKRFEGNEGRKIKRLSKIAVAIDTSGSIDNELFNDFWNEIIGILKQGVEIVLIQCDHKIQSIEKLSRFHKIPEINGRGGTDFNPVLSWVKTKKEINGLVYFTDGYASKPNIKVNIPILWCLYGNNDKTFDIKGKVIHVK